jgi:hypothetical protein
MNEKATNQEQSSMATDLPSEVHQSEEGVSNSSPDPANTAIPLTRQLIPPPRPPIKMLRTLEQRLEELRGRLLLEDEKNVRQRSNIRAVIRLYESGELDYDIRRSILLQDGVIFTFEPPRSTIDSPVWLEVRL